MIEEKDIGGIEYLKVPILKFTQNNNDAYIATISMKYFELVAQLRQVNIEKADNPSTQRVENIKPIINKNLEEEPFNRPEDKERVNKISSYLNKEDSIIPGAIIVGVNSKEENLDADFTFPNKEKSLEEIEDTDWLESFNSTNGCFISNNFIYINKLENNLIIIDGQHRYLAMEKLSSEKKEVFSVPLVFLSGYEPKAKADLFYTINYEQKPVNKSLLINLRNTFLDTITESKTIFTYIEFLNTDSRSPLSKKINMYGKGSGYISLAFLYNLLFDLIKPSSGRSKKISIFNKLYEDEENRYLILQLLLNYLRIIEKALDETMFDNIVKTNSKEKIGKVIESKLNLENRQDLWKDNSTMLTKSIGLGAFILVFPSLILKILRNKELENNYLDLKEVIMDDFENELKNLKSFKFDTLAIGSSLSLMNKIKAELIRVLELETFDKQYFNGLWNNPK